VINAINVAEHLAKMTWGAKLNPSYILFSWFVLYIIVRKGSNQEFHIYSWCDSLSSFFYWNHA
jgi:hypothetical protein